MSAPRGTTVLAGGIATLRGAGVDDPVRDARRLMAHAMGVDAGRLTIALHDPVSDDVVEAFQAAITRRAAFEPVSHIIGKRLFYGLEFHVTPDVLDPRPETEILIEQALSGSFETVLDLGTGSGCILITLLAERVGARGIGADISMAALDVARGNAGTIGVADRAEFRQGDLWDVGLNEARFDLILSNPPYIAADEMDGLSRDVRGYEPEIALTDFGDGLAFYRRIAERARDHLMPAGRVLVETGPTQGPAVAEMFRDAGLIDVAIAPDFDGRDRVVMGRAP